MFNLSDSVAIITGSTRGIGRAIAEQYARAGARVVISSRNLNRCEEVAASINKMDTTQPALAIPADIRKRADVESLASQTIARLGKIDIVVCNAATNTYLGPMTEIPEEDFRQTLESNLLSTHWLITAAAKGMIERRRGAIIIISSIGGFQGSAILGAYNISKAADFQLARNYAVELGPHNIRVNCIAPGLIETHFSKAIWNDPARRAIYKERTPLGRIGKPDDIAGVAVFLASPAAAFMTGQTIVVDGGWTMAGV